MFLPSGRVHAIGAGLVIFEIQQNSDTTYRVFDWNRVGLDGQPRALHVAQSLASIDFDDFEPALAGGEETTVANCRIRKLVSHPLFNVELFHVQRDGVIALPVSRMQILGVVAGEVRSGDPATPVLRPGDFCLLPACLPKVELTATAGTQFLRTEAN
jgi:mannose-6-phosphate isomerase